MSEQVLAAQGQDVSPQPYGRQEEDSWLMLENCLNSSLSKQKQLLPAFGEDTGALA